MPVQAALAFAIWRATRRREGDWPDISIGIDVGGTYTDLAAVGSDGAIEARKVLSTPADQSEGVAASLAELGATPANVRRSRMARPS